MTARFKTGKGFPGARKSTAAIIVLTRRCRGLEETAVAVIRIANNEGNTDSAFAISMTWLADEYRRARDSWLLWIEPPYRPGLRFRSRFLKAVNVQLFLTYIVKTDPIYRTDDS